MNDIPLFVGKSFTGPQFEQMIVDWFDQLYEDGASTGRVMTVGVHPFIANIPSRHRYLVNALRHIASREEVWMTTSDAIADHYFEHYYEGAVAAAGGNAPS